MWTKDEEVQKLFEKQFEKNETTIKIIYTMETLTLKSIFESNKEELSSKLEKLSLPKDSELVQKTVADFLGDLFESEGLYRQNLTESEDYLLQSI